MEGLLSSVALSVKEVRENVSNLASECRSFQKDCQQFDAPLVPSSDGQDFVIVKRSDLERLATETMQLKEFLPKILDEEYLTAVSKLTHTEKELHSSSQAAKKVATEQQILRQRTEQALEECEKEREERFSLQCHVTELTNQLSEQSEYCSAMGLSCFTLLWRVSRQEEVVPAILGGSNVGGFLNLVSCTVQSYVDSYKDDQLPPEDSQELQFVLAACGVLTNIAASAFGRDFLISSEEGRVLLGSLCQVLKDTPEKQKGFERIKSLVLMTLYNVSINLKAVKFLNQNKDLLPTIGWMIQVEESAQIRLNALRLLQSLILDQEDPTVAHRALEVAPFSLLTKISQDRDSNVRQVAMEIMTDLNAQMKV